MQSELEDLCFAVLHSDCYRKLRAERNELWKRNVVSPALAKEAERVLSAYDAVDELHLVRSNIKDVQLAALP